MFLHHCIRKVWRCYTVVAEESVIVPTSFFSSLLRKVVFGLLSLFQPFLVLPIINSWFSSFVFQDQPKVFPLRSDFYFLFWRTPSISEIKEKSCVQSCYTSNLFLSSILSLTHSSRDTWDWRITGGMKPWVGKEYISSSYNFCTFFFFGEIRNLTTFTRLMDYNNGFSISSFFLSLGSFLWIGAQFPQEKFLSYGRILTLYYYFLLMCILFSFKPKLWFFYKSNWLSAWKKIIL